jgi:hypothetical protein
MAESSAILAALDYKHAEARLALERKDLATYTAIFSPELRYHQPDGRTIGRDQLMRDVRAQFRRFRHMNSSFVREQFEVLDERASELLIQRAFATETAFLVVHRKWEVVRKGQYVWKSTAVGWQINEIFVIEESVTSFGFQFGLRQKPINAQD